MNRSVSNATARYQRALALGRARVAWAISDAGSLVMRLGHLIDSSASPGDEMEAWSQGYQVGKLSAQRTAPDGARFLLTAPEVALLSGVSELEVRAALAAGSLAHQTMRDGGIQIEAKEALEWAKTRDGVTHGRDSMSSSRS